MEFLDLKSNNDRIILDLRSAGLENVLVLGRYSYKEAREELSIHKHEDMVEICFLETGNQYYRVGDHNVLLKGGDILITPPNVLHGTSGYPEEKGNLFWMIIKVPNRPFKLLNLSSKESKKVIDRILNLKSIHFKGSLQIKRSLTQIFTIYNNENISFRKIELKNQILNFLLEVIRCGEKLNHKEISPDINSACKYVRSNLFQKLTIECLAKSVNLSESRFKHKFKEEIGIPPNEYILREKINKAKELINISESNITHIAYDLGFSTLSYFSTVFKKHEGVSPTQFKSSSKIK